VKRSNTANAYLSGNIRAGFPVFFP
jgi:hypothetical protein